MSQTVMTDAELRDFLSQSLIADFVTLKKDGSPQITPVWYDFDGTYLYSRPPLIGRRLGTSNATKESPSPSETRALTK